MKVEKTPRPDPPRQRLSELRAGEIFQVDNRGSIFATVSTCHSIGEIKEKYVCTFGRKWRLVLRLDDMVLFYELADLPVVKLEQIDPLTVAEPQS